MEKVRNNSPPLEPRVAEKTVSNNTALAFDFLDAQYILDTLIGRLTAKGNLVDKYRTHNVLKKGEELWKVASATESILSKVRQGKVRVFSDSVLCRRNGAMSEASWKLAIRSTVGQPLRKEEFFQFLVCAVR